MTEPLSTTAARRRLRDSSWFAFGATTTALVILASGGTALLVRSGAEEGRPVQGGASPIAPVQGLPKPQVTSVTVDRVVGTFRPSVPASAARQHREVSLSDLLSPPADPVKPPVRTPEAPEEPGIVLVPGGPPVPIGPGPDPEEPLLPEPLPQPDELLPLQLPLPLPLPLPDLPVVGLLVKTTGS